MQMKNDRGVTLIALIVTIIVLGIILTITLDYGKVNTQKIDNKRKYSELAIVQQAIVQQYAWAKTQGKLGKQAKTIYENVSLSEDSERPTEFVGTRISDDVRLEEKGFKNHKISYDGRHETQAGLRI